MTHVWIAQCLCPQRHAILASAGEAEDEAAAEQVIAAPLRKYVAKFLVEGLNPWCALCHATSETWRYEVRRTRYRTLEEAAPALRQVEAEQIATGAVFRHLLGDPRIH